MILLDFGDSLLLPPLSIRVKSLLDGEPEAQILRELDVQVAVCGLVLRGHFDLADQLNLRNGMLAIGRSCLISRR